MALPTATDLWDDFAHRYAKDTGEQLTELEKLAFFAGIECVYAVLHKDAQERMREILEYTRGGR